MKHIDRWLKKGLIDEDLAAKLEHEIDEVNKQKFKLAMQITLYTIGVILLGTSVITFIAANDWILQLLGEMYFLKVILLLITTLAFLLGGHYLAYEKKNLPGLGNALIFLSTILIGANYALLTQIFNIDAEAFMVLSLWFISIFPLAFIYKSRAVNWLSIILFICAFCSFYEYLNYDTGLIWTLYMPFIIGAILYTAGNLTVIKEKYTGFDLSYKLTALIPMYITFLILIFSAEESYHSNEISYILPPVVLIVFNIVNYCKEKNKNDFLKAETAFILGVTIFMLALLLMPYVAPAGVSVAAHIFIIYLIWAGFSFGYKYENVSLINMINSMLIIYVLATYCRFGWSFMDKTLFFFIGGVVLIAMGIFLEKYKRLALKKSEEEL